MYNFILFSAQQLHDCIKICVRNFYCKL